MLFSSEVTIDKISNGISYVYSYQPLVEKVTFLVPTSLSSKVESLSEVVGFDVDTLRYTIGIFLCYPLGMIMLMLPYGKVKHTFSFLLGAFLLQFTIGVQWIHQLISSIIVYGLLRTLSPKLNTIVVPMFVMAYVSLGHLHRQFVNYLGYDLDFTGPQMVLTMKLYSLAYNILDGHNLTNGIKSRASTKCSKLAVYEVPGIIEYLGYTFNFSTILCGPAYEYKIYANACDGSHLSKCKSDDTKTFEKIPSPFLPTLKPLFTSLLCLVLYVVGSVYFPLLDPINPQDSTPAILQPHFLQRSWLYRAGYTYIALLVIRQRYYFVWKNTEGSNNIWYAGFQGFDSEGHALGWENSNNIDIFTVETASNIKSFSAAWNKKTSNWLNKYIYIRSNGNLFLTYGMSAMWHGFYPGYYLFFLMLPLLTTCERLGRQKLTPRFMERNKDGGGKWISRLYDILSRVATLVSANYCVLASMLLTYERAVAVWKSHYFIGHFAFLLFYIVMIHVPDVTSCKEKKV